jgi:hypothetical protein
VRCPRKGVVVGASHSAILKISVDPRLNIGHYTSPGDNQPGIGRLPRTIDVERSCLRQACRESTNELQRIMGGETAVESVLVMERKVRPNLGPGPRSIALTEP